MACLDMYNSDQQPKGSHHHHHHHHHCPPPPPPMSPRISFSNDFADSQQMMMMMKQERSSSSSSRHPPASSSDFEFSVTGYSMMSADELFSKGRILPFKETSSQRTTIRDELLVDDESEASARPPRGSTARWKGLLGLRRSHIGSKKIEDRRHEQSQVQGCGDRDVEK